MNESDETFSEFTLLGNDELKNFTRKSSSNYKEISTKKIQILYVNLYRVIYNLMYYLNAFRLLLVQQHCDKFPSAHIQRPTHNDVTHFLRRIISFAYTAYQYFHQQIFSRRVIVFILAYIFYHI